MKVALNNNVFQVSRFSKILEKYLLNRQLRRLIRVFRALANKMTYLLAKGHLDSLSNVISDLFCFVKVLPNLYQIQFTLV